MIYSDQTLKAMVNDYKAQDHQLDKTVCSTRYLLIHLDEKIVTKWETIVALIYNVGEDTSWTIGELAKQRFIEV